MARHIQTRTADQLLAGSSGICPAGAWENGELRRDLVQIAFPAPVRVTSRDARKLARAIKRAARRADRAVRD
jgi:hypothetical protein